jgi:hypothetical protein
MLQGSARQAELQFDIHPTSCKEDDVQVNYSKAQLEVGT